MLYINRHLIRTVQRATFAFASVTLFFAFTSCPVMAQYQNIVEHQSEGEGCGSPGARGCPATPTCTAPSGNSLRDDLYLHQIKCDIPGSAEWGGDGTHTVPDILLEYEAGEETPSDTIYTSTDLHFGKSTVSDADHANHSNIMNTFAQSGTHWPRGVGFPDVAINPPAAIVTTGDDTHYGHQQELSNFRLLFEQGWINESTGYPVIPGMGNHDVDGNCQSNNCAKRMFDYVAGHVHGAVNFDPGSDNYSWDWNGVHYIQLNTWAGDTDLGTKSDNTTIYATHASGLPWLITDLSSHLGFTNEPVIIFQHYGYDCFSLGTDSPKANPAACENSGQTHSPWWSQADRQSFWNAIQGYNVVGIFSGHIHSTGMYDITEFGGHLDNFVGGTGGEDPCLNLVPSEAACGGRGHFFALRVTGNFLDVASLEWTSDKNGTPIGGPTFTNLSPDPQNGMPHQGPAFTGGQPGCRKLINSRIVDVSKLAPTPAGIASGNPITITNTSSVTIPGPLALEFDGLDYQNSIDLISKSFVDRCAVGGSSYQYSDDKNLGSLAPGKSLTFTPVYSATAVPSYHLVRAGLSKGASTFAVNLIGTPKAPPPAGHVTIYGPPNVAFTAVNTILTATKNWIAVTPSGTFDQFGVATLTYTPNAAALLNDTANATEITNVTVVTNNPQDILSISITLEMRVADLVLLTPAPHNQITAGTKSVVTTFLKYTPLVDKVNGGNLAATGTMTLKDITNPKSPVSLTAGYLNSGCDPSNDPNCPNEPPNTVILPAVTLSAGVHTLQVSYNGDSYYSPNTSNIFQVDVGQPVLSLATVPANLALIVQGKTTATPATEDVTFDSHYTLGVPSPQAGAVGVRFLFNHWADTGDTNAARTVSINGNTNSYTAAFDTQYLVNLIAVPAEGGTVTSTDEPADGYYPSDAKETITATPNPGYYFTGFTGALTNNRNNQLFNVAPNATINGNFAPTTAPTVTWNPTPIFFGTALGGPQLNANANVSGKYVYTPAKGIVPPLGLGYTLSVTFTPTNPAYSTVTKTATINVVAKGAPTLGFNVATSASSSTSLISVALNTTNVSVNPARNIVLTSATIGTTSAVALPSIPNLAGFATATVGMSFPRSAGAKGSQATLTLTGTSSGGPISYSTVVSLP